MSPSGQRKIFLLEPLLRVPKLWMFQLPFPPLLTTTRRSSGNPVETFLNHINVLEVASFDLMFENSNRGQEACKDRDTPDSFVPSSSPESVVGMEISRYPDLRLVKEEPLSPCLSPAFPLLPAPDGKGEHSLPNFVLETCVKDSLVSHCLL